MPCPANCQANPDAVNKTDYKCDACGADLKKDLHRVFKEREEEAIKAPLVQRKKELEQMIADVESKIDKAVKVS